MPSALGRRDGLPAAEQRREEEMNRLALLDACIEHHRRRRDWRRVRALRAARSAIHAGLIDLNEAIGAEGGKTLPRGRFTRTG